MRPCIIKGCLDRFSKRYRVPSKENIKKIWLERLGDKSLYNYSASELYNRVFVCGSHFIKEAKSTRRLHFNALPSVNIPGFNSVPSIENSFLPFEDERAKHRPKRPGCMSTFKTKQPSAQLSLTVLLVNEFVQAS